jgi:hypothetical protein
MRRKRAEQGVGEYKEERADQDHEETRKGDQEATK